jgi:hypothetical protein
VRTIVLKVPIDLGGTDEEIGAARSSTVEREVGRCSR